MPALLGWVKGGDVEPLATELHPRSERRAKETTKSSPSLEPPLRLDGRKRAQEF